MARLITEDQFLKEVQFVKSAENINDLVTEGGFYTEKEMREVLKWSQCPVIRLETINMFFPLENLDSTSMLFHVCTDLVISCSSCMM